MIVTFTGPATEPLTVAEVMSRCRIDQSNQELAPSAPAAALVSPDAAGNLSNGVYRYRVTFVTADGETEGGVESAQVSVSDSSASGQVALSGLPIGGSAVSSRKIFRTRADGSDYFHLATIADNSATTFTDNVADGSLGAGAPTTSSTSDPELTRLIKMARERAEQELQRGLITQTLDAYFDRFPIDGEFMLPPLSSVTAITYIDINGDEKTLAANQYVVDSVSVPSRIARVNSVTWPSTDDRINAVKVRFIAGYGDPAEVPESIKEWMLCIIKQKYDNPGPTAPGNHKAIDYQFVNGLLDSERVLGGVWK